MKPLYFDLETGPLPEVQLLPVMPEFAAPANLKDQVKIASSLADKRASWIEKCALDALTGRVLAVTIATEDQTPTFAANSDEPLILKATLADCDYALSLGSKIIGFNIRHFDLPFLMRRAWILGLTIPGELNRAVHERYNSQIVDLLDVWLCGDRDFTGQSLGNICVQCGLGKKNGSGKDFAKLLQEDPKAAEAYALNDIELTRKLSKRLGVC